MNNKCLLNCPGNYAEDSVLNKCGVCNPVCITCNGHTVNDCIECANGKYKSSSGCVDICQCKFLIYKFYYYQVFF